jgi:P27 family predicted phage terminase small subunit
VGVKDYDMAKTPKPTALKLVTGNPGKRALNKNEPDPEYLNDLTAPGYLSASAAEVWDEIVPHLRQAKMLTKVDVPMLAMGCNAIAQYRAAARRAGDELVKTTTCSDKDGKAIEVGTHINPWLIVQSMSFKQAMAVFQQFGMSPAARSRVAVNPQGDLFGNGKTGTNYFT